MVASCLGKDAQTQTHDQIGTERINNREREREKEDDTDKNERKWMRNREISS